MSEPVRIKIDLSAKRHAVIQGPRWLVVALLALALLFSFANAYSYVSNASFISDNAELASTASLPSGAELDKLKSEVKAVNAILDKKSFSWVELFSRFESTVPEGVSLSQVTPDFVSRELRIRGEAKSLEAAIAFVDRLNASGYFSNGFLLEHHEVKYEGTDKSVVSFDVKTVYGGGR